MTHHTPSVAITHTAAPLPPIERLHQLQQQVATLTTPTDATTMADQARIITAALTAANHGIDIRNEAAELHLRAERRLGELLLEIVSYGNTSSIPEGITRQRASRAQRLARIPLDHFNNFIESTRSEQKELSQRGALQLLPVTPREERKNIADTYTAPAIDVQLARELGLNVSDELAEIIVTSIHKALNEMENPRHAFVWAKYHGIQDDGTIGERWAFPGIAAMLGKSREYAESLYYRASHHVRGRIAVEALNELQRLLIATAA